MNRKHPILKVKKPHLGTDFGAPVGTPVMAFDAGVVKDFGMKGAMGNMVHIDHGGGIQTYYGHLHGFAKGLKQGMSVKRGQVIGSVGNTGRSTGPHLHFGLKKNGVFVDPMKYLKITTIKEKPIEEGLRDGFEQRARTLLKMLRAIKVPELPSKKSEATVVAGS
jgi:murein DD-endopeptidase MepM/ murein hydrolase activator NlpD